MQSVGVAIAGALIWWNKDWKLADPVCTLLFGCIVMYTTWAMLVANVSTLLEGTPAGVDAAAVRRDLLALPSVTALHDLHIWSLTEGSPVLTAHLNSPDQEACLQAAQAVCRRHGIAHATIQVRPKFNFKGV